MDGRSTTNLPALFATRPEGAAAFHPLLQAGLEKSSEFPDVPLLRDLARTPEQKVVFEFLSRSVSPGRPVATNNKVPPDRLAALRRAFDLAMKDPQLLEDAKRQNLDISPWTGDKLQQVVTEILDTPAADIARIRQAISAGGGQTLPAEIGGELKGIASRSIAARICGTCSMKPRWSGWKRCRESESGTVLAGEDYVSSRDALRILEVKPQTLYSYVSRGLIRRRVKPGHRTSYYNREDIHRLKSRSVARSGHGPAAASAMYWGEPVLETGDHRNHVRRAPLSRASCDRSGSGQSIL